MHNVFCSQQMCVAIKIMTDTMEVSYMKKRTMALVLAGLMIMACTAGCDKKKSSTTIVDSETKHTEAPVVTLAPGEKFKANKGENFTYEKAGLDINFVEMAMTSDEPDNKGRYSYAFVFKAKNNSDEIRTITMLDDFEVSVDGVEYKSDIFSAFSAAHGASAYPDYTRYDTEMNPGDEFTGFVPFCIDKNEWEKMTVTYKPDSKHSNDSIVYTVDKGEVLDKSKK